MMEQYLDLLPPVPGPHPQRFMAAVLVLIVLIIQLLYLLWTRRQQPRYQWRRGVRARQYYNTRN
jgi:hypothetical protein